MSKSKFKVVELFSGIGSQAKALKNINIDFEILNTCDWDIHSIIAYNLLHNNNFTNSYSNCAKDEILKKLERYNLSNNGKEPISKKTLKNYNVKVLQMLLSSIDQTKNKVNVQDLNGSFLPDEIDLLTYSFPCQDLSNVGSFHGYNKGIDRDCGSRSSLLWQVERILLERKQTNMNMPKFLMLENVIALNSKRHRPNFEEWQKELEKLGYYNKVYKLKATDFGLPQTRTRLIMISIFINNDSFLENKLNEYFNSHNLEDKNYIKKLNINHLKLKNILKTDMNNLIYFNEALAMQPNDTPSRRKIWNYNPILIDKKGELKRETVATLTTKQDRHPNSGNIYFDYEGNFKSKFRYLSPRECFMLMGFEENDYERIINNNPYNRNNSKFFTRDYLIRMAGNSIAVKVLEQIFLQIKDIDKKIF